ncbi:hypothetical protein ZIOFF_041928 [Zingiber officinale]|uniref:Neprosin PEP catalytic domain-containing protein n=1 Tax=Zingiber officinale TaxID=94328 RepID=A0A8J5G8C5_ZINOF|nr:hypothetical protein ZIOFF_041928 [Zingiber officinale]
MIILLYLWVKYAIVQSKKSSSYGFRSKITTSALPNVGPDQVSASQVWIMGDIDGPDGSLNVIQSGWHDPKSGNWWLTLPSGGLTGSENIGYWPKELFPSLEISTEIDFGGQVYTPNNEASPPMGGGSFPQVGFGRASHFMQVQFIGTDHQAFTPGEGSVYTENDSLDNYYKVFGDPPESGDFNVYYGRPGWVGYCYWVVY